MKYSLFVGVAALVPALALVGCGGGDGGLVTPTATPTSTGSPTPSATLMGKTAIRAALTTGYQGYRSQVNYPIRALMMALPSTSPFKKTAASARARVAAASSLEYYKELNLYVRLTTKSNVTTFNAYTDAAGTQSAGSATISSPSGTTVGNYSSYPAVIDLRLNITGGTIPCQGSGTITFKGPSGVNTLTGQLFLSRTGVTSNANLSLSSSGQVGGTITFKENGQTTTLSNLSGPLDGDIVGTASVSPGGSTGTGVVNLFAGKYEITLKNSDGTASASANPTTGSLKVTFPDGAKETLTNPLAVTGGAAPNPTTTPTTAPTVKPTTKPTTAPTTKPTTAPTTKPTAQPTTGPVAVSYNTPVQVNGIDLGNLLSPKARLVNNNGQIAAPGINNGPYYLESPTATAIPMNGTATPHAINNNRSVIGNSGLHSFFWSSPSASEVQLQGTGTVINGTQDNGEGDFASDLNDSGQLVGYGQRGGSLYWRTGTGKATSLASLSGADTAAYAINNNGLIVGSSNGTPIYWTNFQSQPKALNSTGLSNIISENGFDTYGVNRAGQLYASGVGGVAYWSSTSAVPVLLPALSGARAPLATGISDDGTIVGYCTPSNGNGTTRAVRWVKGRVQDLNALIPSGSDWGLETGASISGNGKILGTGTFKGAKSVFYLSPVSADTLRIQRVGVGRVTR